MLSAVISSERSYPAVLLAEQLVHQWLVHPGPLVLGATLLNLPTPTADRDRTVSRRSEPSRVPFKWEQHTLGTCSAQDAMSRHRGCQTPRRCEPLGGKNQPVIPGVPFYPFERWALSIPRNHRDHYEPDFALLSELVLVSQVKATFMAIVLFYGFPNHIGTTFVSLSYF